MIATAVPLTADFLDRSKGFAVAGELDEQAIERNLYAIVVWGIVYLTTFAAFVVHYRRTIRNLLHEPLVPLFLGLVVAGVFYSEFPGRAIVVAAPMLLIVVNAGMTASQLSGRPLKVIRAVLLIFGTAQIINLALVVGLPDVAIAPDGRWAGWHSNSNAFGREALITFASALVINRHGRYVNKQFTSICLLVSAFNLVGSGSATSLLGAVFLVAVLGVQKIRRERLPLRVVVLPIAMIVMVVGWLIGWDELTALFGRDSTLTGRVSAWKLGLAMLKQQPWFGFGIADTRYYIFGANIASTNFHNSYLEVGVRMGIVGLLVFMLLILRCLWVGARVASQDGETNSLVLLTLLLLVVAVAESFIFAVRGQALFLFWILLLLTLLRSRVVHLKKPPRYARAGIGSGRQSSSWER